VKSWVQALKRLGDARRERRQAVARPAVLTIGGQMFDVRLLDISRSGAMVVFEGSIAEGENVILQPLDRDPLRGQVRWSRAGRIGIGFETAE
jgi:hypothetical protein